jgi:site-specific DNA recombinase
MATATSNRKPSEARAETRRLIAAVGYCRMSTDRQDTSIDKQREEIEAWAAKNGFAIIRWYIDEGISGDQEDRAEFQRMVRDVQTIRDFEAVICWNQKRFARFDVLDTAQYWKVLRDAEIKLFTVDKGLISCDNIVGFITAAIEQDAANSFLVDLGAEICTVHRRIAEAGFWPCAKPPVGYRVITAPRDSRYKSLAIDETEAAIVRRVFSEYLAGQSAYAIAHRLNLEGLRTSRGKPFQHASIKIMLRNEVYAGAVVFGKKGSGKYWRHINGERTRVSRRDSRIVNIAKADWLVVPNCHDAIISQADFDAVQQRMDRIKALGNRDGRSEKVSAISGLCRCGHCGGRMRLGYGGNKERRLARCAIRETQQCGFSVGLDNVIAKALAMVMSDYLSDKNLADYRAAITKYLQEQRGSGASTQKRLAKTLTDIDAKIAKAEDRLLDVPPDMEQALYRKIRELKATQLELKTEIAASNRFGELSERVIAEQGRLLIERLRDIREQVKSGEPALIRVALEKVVERITIHTTENPDYKPGRCGRHKLARIEIDYRSPVCILENISSIISQSAQLKAELKANILPPRSVYRRLGVKLP